MKLVAALIASSIALLGAAPAPIARAGLYCPGAPSSHKQIGGFFQNTGRAGTIAQIATVRSRSAGASLIGWVYYTLTGAKWFEPALLIRQDPRGVIRALPLPPDASSAGFETELRDTGPAAIRAGVRVALRSFSVDSAHVDANYKAALAGGHFTITPCFSKPWNGKSQ
jgi:hypothetical protein